MSTLPISDPAFVPPRDVERIWAGKDRHYKSSTAEPYDRTRAKAQLEADGGSASDSVLARAVTGYGPNGRIIPGLLPKWPITRFAERPWVVAQQLAAQGEELQNEVRRIRAEQADIEEMLALQLVDNLIEKVEAVQDQAREQNNGLVEEQQRFLKLLLLVRQSARSLNPVAAVLVGSYVLLDVMSDGKLDTVIAWCRLLATGSHTRV